ncbi:MULTISPECIES: DUF2336 domain-containing protein [Bradyrhizobium]|jgi:uncharacterized protein (DUF2336 family)|uniref:DUF2336 domain-containing protein n=1 Tax=Bradyrhizobium TaxID=374 RepID=UPI0004808A94|nr:MULTISPECIES: DUF2336 domain-containing protein [Bradyrhizobium]MCS3444761.1 uncharacterized protein (DUF2336 family) [Bradyrhizobium elkanii]MCS3564111.1 uncharacterized protein (DUF2336 family) [Bradyrhizobium elkanii]MCW2146057.1 uncharacterized protein (DUF2336 family) [Bradyrhizobium elkanii]MCW2354870.1 uncharacterized protein (DUF2336 family) [Bradyrhizobium elkanii]MCW2378884.1 uncharacterized protein (DUF2336 family) [Bradyrhizobium elkanii]
MLNDGQAIVDEVEAAIRAGSADKCLATARRVTSLFLASAGKFNSEQIELFDNVLERLVKTIELRALADISARMALTDISEQLAPVAQAPPAIIRRLASNDEIRIARPILQESSRLSADDLVEIARTKSEQHLLAVAGRWWLKEVVTDALLARRFASVSHRLVSNPGAKVSPGGFAVILAQAEHDPVLAVQTGIRADLPSELRLQLLHDATGEVRARLLERAPAHLFEEIRNAIAAVAAGVERDMARVRDFAAARRHIAKLKDAGDLNEAALLGLARQRMYEETIVALADLAHASIEVIRPLMQSLRSEGLLVPCRVAGLSWETTAAVMECRYSTGSMGPVELANARSQFTRLTHANADRLLRFWQVRASQPAKPGHRSR